MKILNKLLLPLTYLIAAISCSSAFADIYEIEAEKSRVAIAPELYVATWVESKDYVTGNNRTYFDQVLRPSFERQVVNGGGSTEYAWAKNSGAYPTLPIESNTTWVAVQLQNTTEREAHMMLDMFGLGITSWYVVDGNGEVSGHIDDISKVRAGRPVFDVGSVIPLALDSGEVIQVYMGVFALEGTRFRFDLWQEEEFREDRLQSMLIDGLYFGVVAILLLFCIVVFLNIREPLYLVFGLFIFSCGATVFFASGLGNQFLFEDYFAYGADLLFVSTGAVDLSAAIFSILLLRIHQTNKLLFRAWIAVILVNLANTSLAITFNQFELVSVDEFSNVIVSSLVATLLEQIVFFWTLIAYWKSSKVARYWFLVIFTHSAGFIFWTALSGNPNTTGIEGKPFLQLVTVFDALMICGVLAYMYRVERSERLLAQELGVENLRLARDIEQAKGNFISTVSHDLHGPVRAIGFFAETLRDKVSADGKLGLQRIEENVETVSTLLDSLVRLSESESHHKLSIQQTRLSRILYTLKNEFAPIARAKGLTLSIPNSALYAATDAVALSQVLRNLIDNAIKYTDKGSVEVLLAERDDYVSVRVSDTGRGIAADNLTKVFEEFYQVSSRDSEGVGLGLSIVARLTRLLGIEIEVSSVVQEGSRFEMLIPKSQAEVESPKAITQPYAASLNVTGLVLDDGAANVEGVLAQLKGWGVTLVSGDAPNEGFDFVVASTDSTAAWADWSGKTVLLVGKVNGFVPPSDFHLLIPANVSPMKLRSIMQRIVRVSS